ELKPAPATVVEPAPAVSREPPESEGTPVRSEVVEAVLRASDSAVPAPILPSPSVRWTSLRFIAQVKQTYLVCEGDEGLYIIDQHAAAERVNFDRIRKQYRSRAVPSQALLFPITMTVRAEDAELVQEKAEDFGALGI